MLSVCVELAPLASGSPPLLLHCDTAGKAGAPSGAMMRRAVDRSATYRRRVAPRTTVYMP